METFILASKSPRRKEILKQIGFPFKVRFYTIDETALMEGNVTDDVQKIAHAKVAAVRSFFKTGPAWILGADTIVCYNSIVFGKPENLDHARKMLNILSGKTHKVISGVALFNPHTDMIETEYNASEVSFTKMSAEEIEWYLECHEWEGAAGAYRIQEKGALFVRNIVGSFSNIMGLPIHTFYGMLVRSNYKFDWS